MGCPERCRMDLQFPNTRCNIHKDAVNLSILKIAEQPSSPSRLFGAVFVVSPEVQFARLFDGSVRTLRSTRIYDSRRTLRISVPHHALRPMNRLAQPVSPSSEQM